MALTFPREMPRRRLPSQRFELERVDYMSPQADGRVGGVTAGWPLWSASWAFGGMREIETQEWRAWVTSLRGQQRLFYGADLLRPLPLLGLPADFDGDAASWSVNTARDVLTLTGMPAGMKLSPGDYIGFRWTTGGQQRRALVRVLEAATGATPAVTVEPPVPNVVSGSAVAYVKNPTCLMRLTQGTELGEVGVSRILTGRISAIQTLLA